MLRINIATSDSFPIQFMLVLELDKVVLSPYIFNIGLVECLCSPSRTCISWGQDVSLTAYTDTILLSCSKASLAQNFNTLSSKLKDRGLSISVKKMSIFSINNSNQAEVISDRITSFLVSDTVLYLGLPYCAPAQGSKSMLIWNIQDKIRKAFGSIIWLHGIYHYDILGSLFNDVTLPHVLYPALLF